MFTQSFQSIGLGLATRSARRSRGPDRLTVAALGDGGAMMGLPEIETAARLRLPLLFVVYDDAAYGAEVHHFRPMGHPVEPVQFPDADLAAIAAAPAPRGSWSARVADLEPSRLARAPRPPRSSDAKVDPDVVAEWLEEAFRGPRAARTRMSTARSPTSLAALADGSVKVVDLTQPLTRTRR